MPDRRSAVADDLRALADDLRNLVESATTDPRERRRKERRFQLLTAGIGIVTTLAARQAAAKAWSILTGEEPPNKRAAPVSGQSAAPERETVATPS